MLVLLSVTIAVAAPVADAVSGVAMVLAGHIVVVEVLGLAAAWSSPRV